MRSSLSMLAKYTQMIKFVGGPHSFSKHAAGAHACSNGVLPTKIASSSSSSSTSFTSSSYIPNVAFESRNILSKRFRYAPIEELEIEDVNTGGAEKNW